jgi:diguanylate cyclase (GGDEF)-like protein
MSHDQDAPDFEQSTLAFAPTVFLPRGEEKEKSSQFDRAALSPRTLWRHRAAVGMREPLIMMVDDEPLNIEMTEAFLLDAGYGNFASSSDPTAAIAAMRRNVPGILLLDLSMPGLDGLEVLAQMRADALLRHVPVIVLTSSSDPQAKLKALTLGAMDFLSKPVDVSELGLRIRNTLATSAFREYLSQHDGLTSLPNKVQYRKTAQEVLEQALKDGSGGAFIHLGVDRLGRVNDALGRAAGDRLLQRMAKRLASCVQTEADGPLSSEEHDPKLFRFDGDEFAIIIPQLAGMHTVAAFINKLLQDAVIPFSVRGGADLMVTCGAGVAVFPADGSSVDSLMRNAGLALRHAKQSGPHRCEFFSRSFKHEAVKQLGFGGELLPALRKGQIELLYAPRVDLASGQMVSAQALLRWQHSSGRVLEGEELMTLAESAETQTALLEWLLDELRQDCIAWKTSGLPGLRASVKASLAHLQPLHLAHIVETALSSGLDAGSLSLDLKPASALDAAERDWACLAELRGHGVRFCLDGFGVTGTVSHLRRLGFDELKADASFMRDLKDDAASGTMLLGMGDFARRMRMHCIAGAVDDAAQLGFLKKHQWQMAEGRAVGEPLPAGAFAASWLRRAQRA